MTVTVRVAIAIVTTTLLMLTWVCVHQSKELREAERRERVLQTARGDNEARARQEIARLNGMLGYGAAR